MRLKTLELNGFKSFAKKTVLEFQNPIVSIVGPNGSGKSNVVEALRFVLGEQSIKSMRGSLGADLIFKGSKNLPKSSRATVSIYFDNKDKIFKIPNDSGEEINLNYDTVSISREVYSDGMNKYILNGEEVRLKDINSLLSSVNIGSSGHHIISQGEADRILNASNKDRREMVEDALGLKIYQYKIKESLRKLQKTDENMKEVSLLRRENAPHLNFLRKQVEKFEKAKEMRVELLSFYKEYLSKESIYLKKEETILSGEKERISKELENIKKEISENEDTGSKEESENEKQLKESERKISDIHTVKNEIGRKLGRIEGMIEMEEKRKEKIPEIARSPEEMETALKDINEALENALISENLSEIKPILIRIKSILEKFNKSKESENSENTELLSLKKSQQEILEEIKNIEKEEENLVSGIELLKQKINEENEALHAKEKEKFNLKVKHQELTSTLELLSVKEESLNKRKSDFENELKEGSILVGEEILSYKNFESENETSEEQNEELKKKIERTKMKLEDAGAGGENGTEVLKEFEEVKQRDEFLMKEMEDLEKSIESLQILISDLKEKINIEFKNGVEKINIEFGKFFALMFGGGSASLAVTSEFKKRRGEEELEEEEEEPEQGVEINVSLPHKKVRELNALSGGERSLTSIALLFAMSQVNPPPFLVLDETDAALDEANSRKYGDMLEKLSKNSQLIVVTHNRETMSRAGILYGVTIGVDGASKLLSVKLDEAAAIAK